MGDIATDIIDVLENADVCVFEEVGVDDIVVLDETVSVNEGVKVNVLVRETVGDKDAVREVDTINEELELLVMDREDETVLEYEDVKDCICVADCDTAGVKEDVSDVVIVDEMN